MIDRKLVYRISLFGGRQYKIIIMYYIFVFNSHRIKTKKTSLIFVSNILRPFHLIRRVCGVTKTQVIDEQNCLVVLLVYISGWSKLMCFNEYKSAWSVI